MMKERGGMEEMRAARLREVWKRDSRRRRRKTRRARARKPSEMPIQIGVMSRVYLWGVIGIVKGVGV